MSLSDVWRLYKHRDHLTREFVAREIINTKSYCQKVRATLSKREYEVIIEGWFRPAKTVEMIKINFEATDEGIKFKDIIKKD